MAKIASSSSPYLQFSIPFPLFSLHQTTHKPFFLFTTRATEPETPPSDSDPTRPETDDFDTRINQLRIRNRSGIGKKAEIRKGRKSKKMSSSAGVYLPAVPLKEPVSDGLKVELGFTSYSERLNGRIAILGLAALLLVELATGKGVIKYHTSSIIIIQIYFVAAVSALYVKYEKEKNSVWPTS
ncbi:hypothetical protein Lal_00011512 [Lupinus albus]|uniref:Putative chlorophyll a/b binding protein n=1 Tax=Lupinus albus TaxID=3870 RepID=A0A6A5N009_LUPAL|nr:putative chlorophyll a/b binding protein [Lupinus albus]KAF1880454.1 hypothetical protein Lal_00011512 [Lupinus albus]